eukprot:scaffold40896_cov41-Cyclotella_meneghiniana.AAC.2
MDSAVVKEKHTEHEQKRVTLPDSRKIVSSHKCELDLPNLPPEARQGYILPEMQNNSLLSIPSLCETGCQVTFTKENCIVSYKDKVIIMKGVKSKENGLWYVPITNYKTGQPFAIIQNEQANSAYHTSTKAEAIQFLHQCLFSPTVSTLCKAIDNDQLLGFPHLSAKDVRKYLPESTATAKGHMNRLRKGI